MTLRRPESKVKILGYAKHFWALLVLKNGIWRGQFPFYLRSHPKARRRVRTGTWLNLQRNGELPVTQNQNKLGRAATDRKVKAASGKRKPGWSGFVTAKTKKPPSSQQMTHPELQNQEAHLGRTGEQAGLRFPRLKSRVLTIGKAGLREKGNRWEGRKNAS